MDPTLNMLNRLFVTPAEALYRPELLGLRPPLNPDNAATQLMTRGRFPLPTLLVCGRRMVRVVDIVAFAQGELAPPCDVAGNVPRRRGRPSNATLAARTAAAKGEAGRE